MAPETRSISAEQGQDGDRRGDHQQRRAAPPGRDRRRGHRGPDREDDRRPDVGAEAPGGEDEGGEDADRQEGRGAAPRGSPGREPGQPGPGPGDDQHREQRLELVADPVEAHPEARVGAEQRERGQRRAGDDVDRVGEDGQPGGDRQGPVAAEQRQRQRRQQRRPSITSTASALSRLDRGAEQQHQRQVDDRQPRRAAPLREPPAPA